MICLHFTRYFPSWKIFTLPSDWEISLDFIFWFFLEFFDVLGVFITFKCISSKNENLVVECVWLLHFKIKIHQTQYLHATSNHSLLNGKISAAWYCLLQFVFWVSISSRTESVGVYQLWINWMHPTPANKQEYFKSFKCKFVVFLEKWKQQISRMENR